MTFGLYCLRNQTKFKPQFCIFYICVWFLGWWGRQISYDLQGDKALVFKSKQLVPNKERDFKPNLNKFKYNKIPMNIEGYISS